MAKREPRTLLEVAVAHAGMRKGMAAARFTMMWALAIADVGELGSGEGVHAAVRVYADYWGESERTAYRHLQAFRQAFPGHDTPAVLAGELAPQFAGAIEQLRELQAQRRAMAVAPVIAQGFSARVAVA